ncbi:MAG: hypothetical protein QOH13_1083 [Thermoleophilaceae bacterium]|jgi:hypothetical protein|nr:hypothetical protein [Thermoleophilaceae bacterium]
MRFGRLVSLTALALALAAPNAHAARDAELSIMDDQALLGQPQAQVDAALARMVSLGADRVRVSAFWADIAPAPEATTKPAGFDAANASDPAYRWGPLDQVVTSAAAHGLHVLLSLSTPVPYWASSKPSLKNSVWAPKPAEFAAFAKAAATRYRSSVDQFALLNEPNQGAWLQPQSQAGKAVSPHLYRALVQAGYPAVKAGAPGARVLIGELAPSGRNDPGVTRPIRPLLFLRTMGCRTARFAAVRSGRCKGFKAVPADAIGHHPYALFQSPYKRSQYHDDAAIGDWRLLERTLDRLVARKAIKPSGSKHLPIYYTEFGYQTDPPDPFAGIPLSRQSRWLQDAAYVAWRTPRVKGLNQFRVTDGSIRGKGPLAFREFQSGLFFANGKAKPSARTFANPIVVRPSGSRLLVWGQARPGAAHTVTIERRAAGAKTFKRIASAKTSARGYFQSRVTHRTGDYRFRWSDTGGHGTSEAVRIRS